MARTRERDGRRAGIGKESLLTRLMSAGFEFVWLVEFEILFFLFFIVPFLVFKDLTSRPEYNEILVKKPGATGLDWWAS